MGHTLSENLNYLQGFASGAATVVALYYIVRVLKKWQRRG